jgi:inorganic pyrophosphatase
MIRVLIEAEAGSREKHIFDEDTLVQRGVRRISRAYPYPYGFIVGTKTGREEAVDCYILTADPLKTGTMVECEPVGLLEQLEDGEVDHKVLAILPGQNAELNQELEHELRVFIEAVFRDFPETRVQVGRILSKEAALEYIHG